MIVLNIFLTILKIIGITLAVIVGLILFIVLSILLYPIKYKGSFAYKDKCVALIKASWLYHIITLKVAVCGSRRRVCVRVFGIRLGQGKKKSVKKVNKKDKNPKPMEESQSPSRTEIKTDATPKLKTAENKKSSKPLKRKKREKKKGSLKEKFDFYMNKREEIFSKIEDESNQKAVRYLYRVLIKLLKHIKPKKHKVDIIYGAEDPADTGKHLGTAYAISAVLGINLCITPDFENRIFECQAAFKGRIYVIYTAILFLKAYKNENVKQLIAKIKED